jgi:hypothetical protein
MMTLLCAESLGAVKAVANVPVNSGRIGEVDRERLGIELWEWECKSQGWGVCALALETLDFHKRE